MAPDLTRAAEHAETGKYAEAWSILDKALYENPNDPKALVIASFVCEKQGKVGLSYTLAKRVTDLSPSESAGWTNMGRAADLMWRMDEAEDAYMRSLKLCRQPKHTALNYVNLSAVFLQLGQFDKARKHAAKALEIDHSSLKAKHNLGLCQLASHEWQTGWKNYSASVGSGQRYRWSYDNEPEWSGEPDKTIVIYGEQGIGDEVCAASMYNDAIERAGRVIIDCDKRLQCLFRRSFPRATVYGTRSMKDGLDWAEKDQKPDYSISSMQLGGIFRLSDESFPSGPYLKADEDEVFKWKSLWARRGKPTFGIAWTGGTKETGDRNRHVSLDDLLPLFKAHDVTWVSLQYKDATTAISEFKERNPDVDLVEYPKVTTAKNYDDTASLVASLDAVYAVPTSVVHLACALGVRTIAMKGKTSCWKFEGGLMFHPNCILVEHRDWQTSIQEAARA
jgi:tetratricopeptide (TPR) repeat protein